MILQPLIASLNPESLSMPTGTLRNRDASFSSLFLSLSLFTLHPPSRSIPINLRSVSLPFSSRSTLSPFFVLPGGNEKRALWTGPMVLDERYPLPARRTKLRSHRKRRNIVIAATIPSLLFTLPCRTTIYIDVEPNRFAIQPANGCFLTGCSTLDFS